MKLTVFLIGAFAMTAIGSIASGFEESAPVAEAPEPESASAPADVVIETGPFRAVTAWQRLGWFDEKTFGVLTLGGSIPDAAWQTFTDQPRAAGRHWNGFAERYGVSISTSALSNAMEAGIGAAWGEDPRYQRAGADTPLKSRLGHIVKWTVVAPGRRGELRPAYARFIAFSGSSFISNGWREAGDTGVEDSFSRLGFALLGRMGSNAFDEFWPETKRMLFHRAARD